MTVTEYSFIKTEEQYNFTVNKDTQNIYIHRLRFPISKFKLINLG
jgi:hypothetical protein